MGTRNTVGHLGEGEERWLLRRLVSGDQVARRRLIEAHLGIVSAIARRYARRWGVPLEDLFQEGTLALVQAVNHYDPDQGMKLSTSATWWVKQAIRRAAMAQSRVVRVPERLWERAEELSRAERCLGPRPEQEGWGWEPSEASSWSDEELEEVRCALRPVVSLETPVGEGASELENCSLILRSRIHRRLLRVVMPGTGWPKRWPLSPSGSGRSSVGGPGSMDVLRA